MLPPGTVFELQVHQCICGQGFPQTPQGELMAPLDPLLVFRGPLCSMEGRVRKGMGWEEVRKGEGSIPPLLFLQFNHWSLQ